ncbi:MAG: MFS transporter, partial [Bacteroidota bacterium]
FFFYLGLTLLILGNGLFKPNISSIVGQLYNDDADKKDGAYTIFYMGINAGAFLGILLCGYIGERVGWSWGFGLAGIFMFFGMLQFWFAQNIFGKIGLQPKKQSSSSDLVDEEVVDEVPDNVARDRMIVIGVFAFFTVFFWWAFEQAGGSMTIFADDYTDRVLEGGTATAFKVINTILTIGPLIVVTWVLSKLFKITFSSYSTSNIFLGASFVIIWGIALWAIQNDFRTTSYEVEYTDLNNNTRKTDIRTADPLSIGSTVYLKNDLSIESYDEKEGTIRDGYLVDETGNETGYGFTGTPAAVQDFSPVGLFWKAEKTSEVALQNVPNGLASVTYNIPEDKVAEFKTGSSRQFVLKDKLSYARENKDGYRQATVSAKKDSVIEVPASWFGILNSFFIITFAPLFSKLWESRVITSGPLKFSLGLFLVGLGFAFLAFGSMGIEQGAKTASVSMMWLILAYLF